MQSRLKISEIWVEGRARKDFGDIKSLAASIEKVGLLHPLVVDADNKLIAGERRLMAVQLLGWKDVPIHLVKSLDSALLELKAECDENCCRKDFTPTEAVDRGLRLEALERPLAKERRGGDHKGNSGKFPELNGRTRDKVGVAVGMSGKTYEKAKAVVEAAKENPELFVPILEEMDRTGKVDSAFKKVSKAKAADDRRKSVDRQSLCSSVILGDFRNIGSDQIPDGSIDLIFTDPPYDRASVGLYADLAAFAQSKLRDGGSCLAYGGQYLAPEILVAMATSLRLWWIIACLHTGKLARMTEYGIRVGWKPIFWFVKGTRSDKQTFVDDFIAGGGREKCSHEWQQAESEARHFIGLLCPPDGIVCDPFLGGGTTAVAAKKLGRKAIGIELDEITARAASQRILQI